LANWRWKVVRQFIQTRFGLTLGHSSCLNYLHRLGFVLKRPKKRLSKANPAKREACVAGYAALRAAAQAHGAKIFFVDEAHFRADVELRAKWVLRGAPALVDMSSPKYGEKATYYSAVCPETGEVEALSVLSNTTAATSVVFRQQVRDKHPEPLIGSGTTVRRTLRSVPDGIAQVTFSGTAPISPAAGVRGASTVLRLGCERRLKLKIFGSSSMTSTRVSTASFLSGYTITTQRLAQTQPAGARD
jgi:hypothetical protein